MLCRQLEILLELVDHRPPSSVDAEVLERLFEVRNVGFHSRVKDFSSDEGEKKEELLRSRKH